MRIVQLLFGVWVGICFLACGEKSDSFTREERERIGHSEEEGIMPLFLVTNRVDSLFLRLQAKEFGKEDIETETFRVLRSRMLATVRDSLNEGVGIAAPQVGISRQLVAVQRLDKVGEPFEFYVNPEIIYFSQDTVLGQEGCLSIPGRMGSVYRSKEIVVRYRDELSFEWRQDTVREFTARIFHHEIVLLNGFLYTDYLPCVLRI